MLRHLSGISMALNLIYMVAYPNTTLCSDRSKVQQSQSKIARVPMKSAARLVATMPTLMADALPVHGSMLEVLPQVAPEGYDEGASILHPGPGHCIVVVVGYGAGAPGAPEPGVEPGAGVVAA